MKRRLLAILLLLVTHLISCQAETFQLSECETEHFVFSRPSSWSEDVSASTFYGENDAQVLSVSERPRSLDTMANIEYIILATEMNDGTYYPESEMTWVGAKEGGAVIIDLGMRSEYYLRALFYARGEYVFIMLEWNIEGKPADILEQIAPTIGKKYPPSPWKEEDFLGFWQFIRLETDEAIQEAGDTEYTLYFRDDGTLLESLNGLPSNAEWSLDEGIWSTYYPYENETYTMTIDNGVLCLLDEDEVIHYYFEPVQQSR